MRAFCRFHFSTAFVTAYIAFYINFLYILSLWRLSIFLYYDNYTQVGTRHNTYGVDLTMGIIDLKTSISRTISRVGNLFEFAKSIQTPLHPRDNVQLSVDRSWEFLHPFLLPPHR